MSDTTQTRGHRGARAAGVAFLLLLGALLGIGAVALHHRFFPYSRLYSAMRHSPGPEIHDAAPGPWGDLEYTTVTLEIPRVWTSLDAYTGTPTRWFFGGMTPTQVAEALQASGLTPPQIEILLSSAEGSREPPGTYLSPRDDLVLGLSAGSRSYIYSLLSQFPENRDHRDPHRYLAENFNRWLGESSLAPAILAALRQLAYQRGRIMLFSDTKLALAQTDVFTEKQKLIQLLSRQTTLMPILRVSPDADVERLARYWGARGREAEVQSLLESLQRSPHGGMIDILYLLPGFVRDRLYTYPRKSVEPFPDCHYTSANFFNAEPDEKYADMQKVRAAVMSDYGLVTGDFQLGDLILLRDERSEVVHSCNYVADDIVFTKNGTSRGRPWVLMHLQDVIDMYSVRGPVDLRVLRRLR